MAIFFEETERNIIPRWRNSASAFSTEEFSTLRSKSSKHENEQLLNEKKKTWELEQNISSALELVYSSFILNECEIAKSAAEFLKNQKSILPKHIDEIIQNILTKRSKKIIIETPSAIFDPTVKHHRIRILKKRLKDDPRNSVARIDIAREYTINGQFDKALYNIKIALELSPYNRFIIRSVVRYFIHVGMPDYALQILNSSSMTKEDPWLLAASIATSTVLQKTSKLFKPSVKLLENHNFPDFHITELAAALGAHEFYFGSIKKSKKFFKQSLVNPNENALAQIIWTYSQLGIEDYDLKKFEVRRLNEALARDKYNKGDWDNSLIESIRWFNDQPFSRGPARFVSYLASDLLQDYNTAIKICEISLESNPHDFTLLNNIAFSYASKNDFRNAEKYFNKINKLNLTISETIVYNATKGLIEFRKRNYIDGQFYYKSAIDLAKNNKLNKYFITASLYLAKEQLLAGIDSNLLNIERFKDDVLKLKQSEQLEFNQRINNILNFDNKNYD